jgi:hypothetical protein
MSPAPRPDARQTAAQHSLRIANGSLYLSRELCDLYLPGISAIALLQRDEGVFVLPLHGATSGGVLLKIRNAHGDRVAHALEFLSALGIDADTPERHHGVVWVSEIAGLRVEGLTAPRAL